MNRGVLNLEEFRTHTKFVAPLPPTHKAGPKTRPYARSGAAARQAGSDAGMLCGAHARRAQHPRTLGLKTLRKLRRPTHTLHSYTSLYQV